MTTRRLPASERRERVVPSRVKSPEERSAVVRKATSRITTQVSRRAARRK